MGLFDVFRLAGDYRKAKKALKEKKKVLLLGEVPFATNPTSFRIALAGRTSGNTATVIHDHPLTRNFPHEGF